MYSQWFAEAKRFYCCSLLHGVALGSLRRSPEIGNSREFSGIQRTGCGPGGLRLSKSASQFVRAASAAVFFQWRQRDRRLKPPLPNAVPPSFLPRLAFARANAQHFFGKPHWRGRGPRKKGEDLRI